MKHAEASKITMLDVGALDMMVESGELAKNGELFNKDQLTSIPIYILDRYEDLPTQIKQWENDIIFHTNHADTSEAVNILIKLGETKTDATSLVQRALCIKQDMSVEELVQQALKLK